MTCTSLIKYIIWKIVPKILGFFLNNEIVFLKKNGSTLITSKKKFIVSLFACPAVLYFDQETKGIGWISEMDSNDV